MRISASPAPGRRGAGLAGSLAVAACAILLAAPGPRAAETGVQEIARPAADLFARPLVAGRVRVALTGVRSGDVSGAIAVLDELIAQYPTLGDLHGIRAALAMLADDPDRALAELEFGAGLATPDLADMVADPVFAPLETDPGHGPRLAALLEEHPAPPPRQAVPAQITDGRAVVAYGNTVWDPTSERLRAHVAVQQETDAKVLPDTPKAAAHDILRDLYEHGRAAGNLGDLYDNRDRGHSRLDAEAFPQLVHVVYSRAARDAGTDYGLNEQILFNRPVLGNSSTALVGRPWWRSQVRHALTNPDGTGPMRLWQNVRANHLYVYPAHRDFTDENGDLFPANTPYVLVSRGSSGSDRPFLEAVAMILAAFRPDTKARLIEEQMLVSTIQMVFRRSLQNVRSREGYFSGTAHPAVFSGREINAARMVSLANSIAVDAIPAEVRLKVLSEDRATEGRDYFGQGLDEHLFDTPQAIARIWRSKGYRRTMIVSAKDSRDANGRPLSFHWHLLQGNPERVRIEPLADGSQARITLDWHDPFPVSEATPLTTARVDIGVFAHNGIHDSAPAILSWYFPPHESRVYEAGPDGQMRIVSIDHADPDRADTYADPLLFPRAGWRDEYAYDGNGDLLGWTRYRGESTDAYNAAGARILDPGTRARPERTAPVAYVLRPDPGGTLVIEEVPAGRNDP